jgi:two-component system, cell cycle sensor histidine kinase and response regulator CckA
MNLTDMNILVVEDNPGDAFLIQEMLLNCKTTPAHYFVVERMEKALGYLAEQSCDIVLLDLHLPDSEGLATLDRIVDNWTGPVIVLTGNSNEDIGIAAIERGAMDYLVKGTFSSMQLTVTLHHALQRRKTEQSLRDSVELFESLFRHHSAIKFVVDQGTGAIIDANDAAAAFYGWSVAELRTMNVEQINTLSIEELHVVKENIRLKKKNHFEFRHRLADGSIRDVEVYSGTINTGNKELIHSIVHDITQRKQAERERERLQVAIDQAGETIVITDTEGTIEYINPVAERVTGYSRQELIGSQTNIFKSGQQDTALYDNLWATIAGGKNWTGRLINRRKDGSLFTEASTISPIRNLAGNITSYVAVKRDITEKLLLEAQLLQAQKMESVGRLAGGVAHDFNNMLSVILGFTQMAIDKIKPGSILHEDLLEVLDAAKRSANITRQLLAFARKQTIAPRVLNLNETIEDMLKMLRRLLGEDINLVWRPQSSLWLTKIDPSQIDQLLANLCVNSRDAITGVGKITIETGHAVFDESYSARHIGAIPGKYVLLTVEDNGCGMVKEVQDNIFEPFFTTKKQGQGTGLGLATVYGIVKQNNGFITLYSEPGQGASFKIYLPQYDDLDGKMENEKDRYVQQGRGETVLVVEDEPAILRMTGKILENLGYVVHTAATVVEAIGLADTHRENIQLLIIDVVMPEMNGQELAELLRPRIPGLKFLFMSGYTSSVIAAHGVLDEGIHFIHKPFSQKDLAEKVYAVLE